MSVWGYILQQTQTPGRMLLFGALTVASTGLLGSIFSSWTASPQSEQDRKRSMQDMTYDGQRTVEAQQQRLSHMIKDMVDGQGDAHWKAAMRGSLVPHPNAESKTMGTDNERAARQGAPSK